MSRKPTTFAQAQHVLDNIAAGVPPMTAMAWLPEAVLRQLVDDHVELKLARAVLKKGKSRKAKVPR